jgi:recombination protein RecT
MNMAQEAKKQTETAVAPVKQQNALQVRQQNIRDLIEKAKPKFAAVIPKHIDVDRLVRVTIASINKTPALLNCTQDSLLNAIMIAAQLGVEPTGVLGSAYLVPYGTECTLIVGYRGLIDLARRSGQIESIEAHVVHDNDRFTLKYGLEPVLEHEPAWAGDPGPVKAVYAIAKLKDGGKQIEVMTKQQVDAIRAKSKAGTKGPWVDHYEEMARKTVVRRICKYLPLTPELADAFALDEEGDQLEQEQIEVPKGTAGLKAIVKAKTATVEAEASEAEEAPTAEEREPGSDDGEPPEDTEAIDPTAPKK